MGFKTSTSEPCLFVGGSGDDTSLIALYVDDISVATTSTETFQRLKSRLASMFNIKDLRVLNFILEMKVNYGENCKMIHLSQEAYIRQVLARYIMDQVKPTPTPMTKSANQVLKKRESR